MEQDLDKFLSENLDDMVESHLDNWSDRYYRKTLDDIIEDIALNYDFSCDIECVELGLERPPYVGREGRSCADVPC